MNDDHDAVRAAGAVQRVLIALLGVCVGAASLAWGMRWIGTGHDAAQLHVQDHHRAAIATGVALLVGSLIFFILHRKYDSSVRRAMADYTSTLDRAMTGAGWLDLILASILGLFLEVVLIRWHGTEFRACAYFKNITLIACFLGLGLGFAQSRRSSIWFPLMPVLLALQVLAMDLLSRAEVDRAIRNPVDGEIFWSLPSAETLVHLITFYGFFAALFISTILIFIPIGQLTGRLMRPDAPLASYTVNIIGSLVGVGLFAAVSWLWLPPTIWFGLAALLALWLARHHRGGQVAGALACVAMIAWLGYEPRPHVRNIYSPYQRLEVESEAGILPEGRRLPLGVWVAANKTYYMQGINLSDEFAAKHGDQLSVLRDKSRWYALPYRFRPSPDRVLIVGAGAGNDVAAAVRNGAKAVDAVEIDPAILWVGRNQHPESPYQAPGVKSITNDARAYMKQAAAAQYDLIVFGLLDSHTLLSGMSSVRLDNFVYTRESFEEAKRLLKPGGLVCLSFAVPPDGPFPARLFNMLSGVFGHPPRTYGFETQDTMFVIGPSPADAELKGDTSVPETTAQAAAAAAKFSPTPATDDWPFPFLPGRSWSQFPLAYAYLIGMLLAISTIWILATAEHGRGFSAHFFFLGGAFLLIETKGITELALVFGTTWVVASVVIAAILTLILFANWTVSIFKPLSPHIFYLGLVASLLAGYFFPVHSLMNYGWTTAAILASILLCLPLYFAGVVFATSLKHAPSLPAAFASNLLGAILGGLCEYTSMVWGFRNLYLVGLGLYALSWLFVARRRQSGISIPSQAT
jgi:SAM-dependent methyltransferase